ncbi:GemA [Sinorhizobium phage Aussie]|nr:GemA [Sinorhizobium phage Aussie]
MSRSLASIHLAKKHFGLDDDTYRAKLKNITGKSSIKEMTEDERQQVLAVFRNEGFKSAATTPRPNGRAKLTGRFAGKLQALWIACYNLGIVANRDDAALLAFVKRQTGIDHVRFLKFGDDAQKAIEALKGWMAREGGVVWSNVEAFADYDRADGYKIAWAQWQKLYRPSTSSSAFRAAVLEMTGVPVDRCTPNDWIAVMNDLGRRIRAKAGA